MGAEGTINVSRAHSLIMLFVIVAGAGGTFVTTQNGISNAVDAAARAQSRADAAYAKAEAAETLARDKGEQATAAMNTTNVKLARIEALVEQLVKDSGENKAAVRALQDRASGGK